jgi:Xaa-Pro dipeptidase
MAMTEEKRALELLEAQTKAEALFHAVEARRLIRPGITESSLNTDIYALAQEMYGITTYWHKRIVRSGANTLLPYAENPPDLMMAGSLAARSQDISSGSFPTKGLQMTR